MAETKPKSFWRSRIGEGIALGIFLLPFLALHLYDWVAVSVTPEAWELKERLLKGDDLKDYFAFVAFVEPDWRIPTKSGGRRPRLREVTRSEGASEGYVTFHVTGWRRLSDHREGNEWVTVYFKKQGADPITIVRVVPYWSRREE